MTFDLDIWLGGSPLPCIQVKLVRQGHGSKFDFTEDRMFLSRLKVKERNWWNLFRQRGRKPDLDWKL